MTEQIQTSFLQRCMQDFVAGASWAPSAGGPTGYARPQGNDWRDSPTLKLGLDLAERLRPDHAARAAARSWPGEPDRQAQAVIDGAVLPGLEVVAGELEGQGYPVELSHDTGRATLRVTNYNGSALVYDVEGQVASEPVASLAGAYRDEQDRYPVVCIASWGRKRLRRPAGCSQRAIERDCRYEMHKTLLW